MGIVQLRTDEMTAALETSPEHTKEIRARYGVVSNGQMRAVETWWKENVAKDPKARAKWRALVDLYVRRLQAR